MENRDPYDNRKLNQQYIHWYNNQDIISFLQNLHLWDWEIVLDIWCWEGKIWFSAMEINPNIKLISMDFSQKQLDQAKSNLESLNKSWVEFLLWSITETWLKDNSIDEIVAKMVLHEIQKQNQLGAIQEMYRILKPWWKLAIRCVDLNNDNQKWFQKIAKEKDNLAWFQSLVTNRHFFTWEELISYSKEAWFSNIEDKWTVKFIFDPDKFLTTDFGWDNKKLIKLRERIFQILNEDRELKKNEVGDWKLNIGFRIYILTK